MGREVTRAAAPRGGLPAHPRPGANAQRTVRPRPGGGPLEEVDQVAIHLEVTGEAERTVVVLVSDNGTSAEGGPHGTWNQLGHYISDEPDDLRRQRHERDQIDEAEQVNRLDGRSEREDER